MRRRELDVGAGRLHNAVGGHADLALVLSDDAKPLQDLQRQSVTTLATGCRQRCVVLPPTPPKQWWNGCGRPGDRHSSGPTPI